MCNIYAFAAMAVFSAYGSYQEAQGNADILDAKAKVMDVEAQTLDQKESIAWKEANLSEVQAMEVRKIGANAERRAIIEGERVTSGQTAAYGASGIRVDSGVVQDIREETEREVYEDSMTIRANTEKEAYGYELKAWTHRGEARTYHTDAILARRGAKDTKRLARSTRNMSMMDALVSGVGTMAGYKGKK